MTPGVCMCMNVRVRVHLCVCACTCRQVPGAIVGGVVGAVLLALAAYAAVMRFRGYGTRTCTHAHMHTRTLAHMHVHTCTCTHAPSHTCVHNAALSSAHKATRHSRRRLTLLPPTPSSSLLLPPPLPPSRSLLGQPLPPHAGLDTTLLVALLPDLPVLAADLPDPLITQ
jgi:hypothetical protein